MKAWWPLLLVLVPGGSLIALGLYLRRRLRAEDVAEINGLIKAPRPVFVGADESLEVKARARREIADQVKKRSALIASGSSSASVLKMVKKA